MNIRKVYLPYAILNPKRIHQLLPNVQSALLKKGFLQGYAHSIHDSNIREAITHFQESENLTPTGTLDPITAYRLLSAGCLEITPIAKKTRAYSPLGRANILLTKSHRQITLFDGNKTIRQYPVAIGKPATPTPEGNYAIATKILNPGGVLGTRWMGLNFDAYGIHGTNRPWLIGQMVSNGCIRMHNPHAEELFTLVNLGTPVHIRQ
ncbi:hypothetical protein SDC9_14739 [bioreactor metagenome]|uniref:L,D-TPase catalytic domain-containing protein n=1 Tax=bioreactor metagenome TaxID=1076179 RepID=A0A644TPT4_9ZZZZ|nr:L,D-transpeptidase family protein [Negativicutes bacterium]